MGFEILTKAEAAARARISPGYLHKLIKDGKGPALTRVGRRVLVRTDALQTWIESCSVVRQEAA